MAAGAAPRSGQSPGAQRHRLGAGDLRRPALRHGTEAVTLAEHAAELTSGREPAVLATLAAAYAEAGRFDRAVELENRAIVLAAREGNAPLAATLRARLAQLQAKMPIRQP